MPRGKNISPEESTAGAGGARDTDTVGTSSRRTPAAGGPVGPVGGSPGGNLSGSKHGTTGGEGNATQGYTGLGVADDDAGEQS